MTSKTFSNAVNELTDKRIIYPVGTGIILPHDPGLTAPAVLERLAKAQAANATIAPGTKRTLKRLSARAKNSTGN